MSRSNAISPERAALITERIGETFGFMRDVLDGPSILDEIPDETDLEIRQVAISGQVSRIFAHRSESDPERWIARTTGRANLDSVRGHDFSVSIRLSSNVSAEAAMDGVEAALRAAEESDQIAHRIA